MAERYFYPPGQNNVTNSYRRRRTKSSQLSLDEPTNTTDIDEQKENPGENPTLGFKAYGIYCCGAISFLIIHTIVRMKLKNNLGEWRCIGLALLISCIVLPLLILSCYLGLKKLIGLK